MEIALLGHMGRDDALADRLMEHKLHIIGQWDNPGLVEKSIQTGGTHHVIDSIKNVEATADIIQTIEPDMFLTNFDDSLAAGVVDTIRDRVATKQMSDLLIPCPNKEASRVEWDKFYLRELIDRINPKYNPLNFMAENDGQVREAISFFRSASVEVAIKPRNLTGGKGVKVQGKHFKTHEDGEKYALEVLSSNSQTGVEIQEKLSGQEFTLQIFTDGETMVQPPETFDYPYREDNDKGPGTGGMGAFSMKPGEHLPFVTDDDYKEAMGLMSQVLQELKNDGVDYKGVLYPTFFKTRDGLKIVEINARGGDPELINILDVMEDDVDMGQVLTDIANGELKANSVRYKNLSSTLLYLVSPDYAYAQGPTYEFNLDEETAQRLGVKFRFAAAEKVGTNTYRTVGSSRSVGLSALGETPWDAQQKITRTLLSTLGTLALDWRNDVGSREYILSLTR